MHARGDHHVPTAPRAEAAGAVAALLVYDCERDTPLVSIPRPEVQLVVRFAPSAPGGVDVHAFGAREKAHRKHVGRGQRTVTARLHLGAAEAVLGVSAPLMAGRIVALHDLWGDAATQRLRERLLGAADSADASAVLAGAIAERLARSSGPRHGAELAIDAAERLTRANVHTVAVDLQVSERHLRRVFRESVGVSPKTFARLTRFHRALRAAWEASHASWASIAAAAGYYDQAHLNAEFRAITGVTPRALLGELRGGAAII